VLVPKTVATVSAKNNNRDFVERFFYVILTCSEKVGFESKHTPQHITLLPPFPTEPRQTGSVMQVASRVANMFTPFDITLAGNDNFGPNKNIPVILVKTNVLLHKVHNLLIKELKSVGLNIYDYYSNEFLGYGFTPHVTIKKIHPVVDKSKPITVGHIAVMRKYKNTKTVVAKYNFGNGNEK